MNLNNSKKNTITLPYSHMIILTVSQWSRNLLFTHSLIIPLYYSCFIGPMRVCLRLVQLADHSNFIFQCSYKESSFQNNVTFIRRETIYMLYIRIEYIWSRTWYLERLSRLSSKHTIYFIWLRMYTLLCSIFIK